MKQLQVLNKYFWKYRNRFILGFLFIILANYFRVLAPQLTGYVIDAVAVELIKERQPEKLAITNTNLAQKHSNYDAVVKNVAYIINNSNTTFTQKVMICSLIILLLALLSGAFTFLMRQTIIVMSRHIEFDQKNEIFTHYQQLDIGFFKANTTGDLMTRISEDVSRIRMYTGPAVMYLINLVALIGFCLVNMLRQNVTLTIYVLSPLPILALTIYIANTIIDKQSEKVQASLSDLTTNAQESYSGIRVIKSFVQENAMLGFFKQNSENYRKQAVGLAKVESIYFPSIIFMIGLSTLLTIFIGGKMAIEDPSQVGLIVEFVIYINMLTFPVSAIGWTASMIQRAAASQKRINAFLSTNPAIQNPTNPTLFSPGTVAAQNVSFTYANTGIEALKNIHFQWKTNDKILILGKTGSGKTTLAQLLLRFYDANIGTITYNQQPIQNIDIESLRGAISYVPQDVFLFSATVKENISFGLQMLANDEAVQAAAKAANIHDEIMALENGYETVVGERGVMLSGGQKQRISIARALLKKSSLLIFDDCLSAVDANTENTIINNLYTNIHNCTTVFISHRIFTKFSFTQIIVLDQGQIIEQGTHEALMQKNGYYKNLYYKQVEQTTKQVDVVG